MQAQCFDHTALQGLKDITTSHGRLTCTLPVDARVQNRYIHVVSGWWAKASGLLSDMLAQMSPLLPADMAHCTVVQLVRCFYRHHIWSSWKACLKGHQCSRCMSSPGYTLEYKLA